MNLAPGDQIDRYTLAARLGQGGQAEVWRVLDPLTPQRPVALKLLWLDAAGAIDAERARREARHLSGLAHPSLPACHGLFEDLRRRLMGLVLDLIDGTPLDQAISDPRWSPAHTLPVVTHVAEGLAYLHAEGLVHRDIKPSNILITEAFWSAPAAPGSVKLIDLGISVTHGNPQPLTAIGCLIGTPPFMPPEQIDPAFWAGRDDTPAADVFALGVVAWWMLHGTHPAGVSLGETLPTFARAYRAVIEERRPWPATPPSPPWSEFFLLSLALAQADRARDASALLPLLGATASVAAAPLLATREAPSRLTGPPSPLATAEASSVGLASTSAARRVRADTGEASALDARPAVGGATSPMASPGLSPLRPPATPLPVTASFTTSTPPPPAVAPTLVDVPVPLAPRAGVLPVTADERQPALARPWPAWFGPRRALAAIVTLLLLLAASAGTAFWWRRKRVKKRHGPPE